MHFPFSLQGSPAHLLLSLTKGLEEKPCALLTVSLFHCSECKRIIVRALPCLRQCPLEATHAGPGPRWGRITGSLAGWFCSGHFLCSKQDSHSHARWEMWRRPSAWVHHTTDSCFFSLTLNSASALCHTLSASSSEMEPLRQSTSLIFLLCVRESNKRWSGLSCHILGACLLLGLAFILTVECIWTLDSSW